ncbi:MAG: ATP synthase F1 subunit delta [Acidobacteriota bacterium]|nr:ATP synthase F1 subunit delta [Acidobacteriota bacterium]
MSVFAHSYARAVLEAAPPGYDMAGFLENAGSLARAVAENATLRSFLSAPAVPHAAKREALTELARRAGLDEFGQRFFLVMLKNHRLLEAEQILRRLREEDDARQGIVRGKVTVAVPIADADRTAIEDALAGRIGGKVRLRTEVDQAILAGFVARVGSNVFDASAATAIRRFREKAIGRTGA